ncbi:MAG: MFS transporter [Kytococcus sp.]|uniref:MFS transporter n=1 Tax=Janibacter terrae TaxID=103817 RepID=UPI0009EE4732|nr:MFS transporter [Janibacter terrae]MBA4086100.1 MFS transporter [Kytococcus sp.]
MTSASATTARNAVLATFAVSGFAFASWAARIPTIRGQLDLTPGELGRTLLVGALGSVVSLPFAGRVITRVGAARTVMIGVVTVAVGLLALGAAVDVLGHLALTAAAIFVVAVGISLWDVAMNHEGAAVEQRLGRTMMPVFHACFSGGTVLGALVAAGVIRVGLPVVGHLAAAAAVALVVGLWVPRGFLARDLEVGGGAGVTERPGSAWLEPRTLVIGVVVLVAALTEGTANDWIALAVTEGHDQPEEVGVLAFATFLAAMTAGRLLGVRVLDRFGRVPVLRVLFGLAVVGSLLVVLGGTVTAFVGVVLWGVGASLGFPTGMSAAADDPARAAARLSVVSTIGYLAFIVGPPLLGLLGDHVGVLRSLLLVGVLAVPALLAVPAVRERAPRDAGHADLNPHYPRAMRLNECSTRPPEEDA